jgi:hypothetical protein
MTAVSYKSAPSIALKIGFPAVPDGSPASALRARVSPFAKSRNAQQRCVAS